MLDINKMSERSLAELVNTWRHEVHNAHFDRIEEIKRITGIDYDELLKIHKHKAMDVWHQAVREWVDKRRYGNG